MRLAVVVLTACIILFVFEDSRGMPHWCYWPLAHVQGCAEAEFNAFYYGTGNPWPGLKYVLFIQGALQGADVCRAGTRRSSGEKEAAQWGGGCAPN